MKIIKRILVIIAVFIGILLLAAFVALFVKKEYAVEREIVINKPKDEVFQYLKLVKNQDNFSKWNRMDPKMKKSYKGTDGQVGFSYSWDSKDKHLGKGQQIISKIVEGERIDTRLIFTEPMQAEDDCYFTLESVDANTTKVKWGFTGAYPYPFNLMRLVFDMDKEVGGDFATGLSNLKKVLENNTTK